MTGSFVASVKGIPFIVTEPVSTIERIGTAPNVMGELGMRSGSIGLVGGTGA